MFAHKVIESLEGRFSTSASGPKVNARLMQAAARGLAHKIDTSPKVDLGDGNVWMDDNLHQTALDFSRAGCFKLPFPAVWVEATFDTNYGRVPVGAYCIQDERTGDVLLYPLEKSLGESRAGRDVWRFDAITVFLSGGLAIGEYSAEMTGERPPGWKRADICSQGYLSALAALSATGVRLDRVEPPEALNRRRLKRGQRPLYSYHVLNVSVPSLQAAHHGPLGHDRTSPRLHWRRGHLRRAVGAPAGCPPSIPVQACLVGVGALGAVDKDYRVTRREATMA